MCLQSAARKEPNSDHDQAVKIDLEEHVQVAVEKQPQKTDTYKDEYEYQYILEAHGKEEESRSVPTPIRGSEGRPRAPHSIDCL